MPYCKRLVLAGAGHAHLALLAELPSLIRDGCMVATVSPSPFHWYSGMGPSILAGTLQPDRARFDVMAMTRQGGGAFIKDRLDAILPDKGLVRLASGRELPYDVLSCDIGSLTRPLPWLDSGEPPPFLFPAKPIENLSAARRHALARLAETPHEPPAVAVVGGGPAGVEIAGNAWRLFLDQGVAARDIRVTLYAGDAVLPAHPAKARRLVLESFARRGIKVAEGVRVTGAKAGGLFLDKGETARADMVIVATGTARHEVFAASGLPTGPDGGLLVNARLQCPAFPAIFGAGDCASLEGFALDKVGVHATRQGPLLAANLRAALRGETLRAYDANNRYMLLLNLGDGTGLFLRGKMVWRGRLWLTLKNWIDRRFVRGFQRRTGPGRTGE